MKLLKVSKGLNSSWRLFLSLRNDKSSLGGVLRVNELGNNQLLNPFLIMVMPLQCTITGIVFDVPRIFLTEFQDKLAPFLLLQVSSLRYFCSYSNVLKQTTGT